MGKATAALTLVNHQSIATKYGLRGDKVGDAPELTDLLKMEERRKPGKDGVFWHDYYELL